MTQRLEFLFGEILNDDAFVRAAWLPAGVYEGLVPAIAGIGPWTVSLGVGANGLSRWRAQGASGSAGKGNPIIREDAAVQVTIAAASAQDRIDIIVGYYEWVAGPLDPISGQPTGVQTTAMNAVYTVVQGTPGTSPVAPVPPDPDGSGRRPVILAQVYVPHTGTATVTRWDATDLRLDYMRATTTEVVAARAAYASLKARLDAMGLAQQVQALDFQASCPSTGGGAPAAMTFSLIKSFGPAITARTTTTIGLTQPGVYEVICTHRAQVADGTSGLNSLELKLNYNATVTVSLDKAKDSNASDEDQTVIRTFYIDPTWTDPYVFIMYDSNVVGDASGSVKFLGLPTALGPLSIANGNQIYAETATQTWPDSVDIPLIAVNAVGAVTWSIVSGAGLQDGTTDPAATITGGSTLHIAWTANPGTVPKTWSVELQATDSASPARTITKTITITLNPYSVAALTITSTDKAFSTPIYPYNASFTATGTGGVGAYTWAIVGAGTTLPSAAINASTGVVTSSVSAAGTWTLELQVTDSATPTPTVVTKTINVTVTTASGGGGGSGCVPAGTAFATPEGFVPIESVLKGTRVRAYDEFTFEPVDAIVEEVIVYQDRTIYRVVTDKGETRCSGDHRIWIKDAELGPWRDNYPPVESVGAGSVTKWETAPGVIEETTVIYIERTGIVEPVYHVKLDKGHLFVAGRLVAHNMKPVI